MKALFAASFLALVAASASAQPPSNGNAVTITSHQPAIDLPSSPFIMHAQEFGRYVGSYDLSNGKSIHLFVRAGTKYAALEGEAEHVLVAASDNSFVAKDRQLAVTIELHEDGQVSGEVLMVVPNKLADGTTQSRVVRVAMH